MSHHVPANPEFAKRYGVGAQTLSEEFVQKLLHSESVFQRQRATLDTPDALGYVILELLDMVAVANFYGYKSVQPFYSWLQRYDLIRFTYDTLGSVIETLDDAIVTIQDRAAFAGATHIGRLPVEWVFYVPPSLEGLTIKEIRHIRSRLLHHRTQNLGRNRLKIRHGELPPTVTASGQINTD